VNQTFAVFGQRNYRLLWGGTLFSTTAFMTTFLLVPIVAFEISGSYAASGIAQMGSGITMLLLGPIGGVIADRYAKKPLVLIGQILPGLLILGTGVLVLTGAITLWILFISTMLMGAGFALMGPARQAWMSELIPRNLMGSGVAVAQVAQNLALVLGPMLGSILLIFFAFGSGEIYFVIVACFLVAIPLTTGLPKAGAVDENKRRGALEELRAGFQYLRGNPRLRILWGYWMVASVCRFASQVLLPGFIEQEFGVPASDTFILYLVVGVVALVMNVPLAGLVSGRRAWQMLISFGFLMAAVFTVGSMVPSFMALMGLAVFVGISTTGVMLSNQALMMTNSRPDYFGRVMSFLVLGFAAQSLLAPVWGASADLIGGRETLFMVGMIITGATLLLTVGWLRTRGLPLEVGSAAAAAARDRARAMVPRVLPPEFAAAVWSLGRMVQQKSNPTPDLSGD
jgi:predicted MFS family arabinose efflux permease